MIITVKKPGNCPLRYFLNGSYGCRISNLRYDCDNKEVFPTQCPLRGKSVLVQKEGTEPLPKHEEKPVTADLKSENAG